MSYEFGGQNNQYFSEKILSDMIARFDTDLIFDIIDDNNISKLKNDIPNIVYAYGLDFKDLMNTYGVNDESVIKIKNVERETYLAIIWKLSKLNSCVMNEDNLNSATNEELYNLALSMYNIFISFYLNNICTFFTNFILREKNNIYKSFGLNKLKKNKNSNSIYNKKIFDDQMIAVISSNLEYVVKSICTMNISFKTFLSYIYNQNELNFLFNYCNIDDSFFNNNIASIFMQESNEKTMILLKISVSIQLSCGNNTYNFN